MVFKKIITFFRYSNKTTQKSRKLGKMSVNDSITTQSPNEFFNDAENTTLPNTSNVNNNSKNDSQSREVSPKLVVRGKKYGRRSRPQSAAMFESSQSDSDGDYDVGKVPVLGEKSKHHHYQGVSNFFFHIFTIQILINNEKK